MTEEFNAVTEIEKRHQRQVVAYDEASSYEKGVMDCAAWLAMMSDLDTWQAKRLAQQMRNKLIHKGAKG